MSSKRELWFRHIEAWRTSGLAQSEYARKHGLSIKSFNYYRRRYFLGPAQDKASASKASLLPVTVIPETITTTAPDKPKTTNPGITLISPQGFRIELAADFDQKALRQVLKMLEVS